MEVNIYDDEAEELFRNMFEQLEGLSLLSEPVVVAETTDPWNINALLEPLSPQFQKRAPPPQHASSSAGAGVLENLDQLMGPEYRPDTQDQSVQFGTNKRIIGVDPTQQLDQCYIAETSQSINPTLQTGRSPSQTLFTAPPESIHFTPVGSCARDTNQQKPRKRQRR